MYYKKKKKQKKYLIISILVVLFVITVIFNNRFEYFKYNFITQYIQDVLLSFNKSIVLDNDSKNNYDNLLKEVEVLKLQNEKLKETLDINTTLYNKEFIVSTVINRNMNYWYDSITIDKGKTSNIKSDQAVTYKGYLIGKTTKVSNNSSIVRLLTSNQTNNKISVKLKVNDDYAYGLLSSYDKKYNYYKVEGISGNMKVNKDTVVYTTGFSDIFPSDIEIGKVSKIEMDNFDLSYTLYVKPSVNVDSIDYVTVLDRK